MKTKYRYLAQLEHAKVWIEGGILPIFPARTYLNAERKGIFTPDETWVYQADHPLEVLTGALPFGLTIDDDVHLKDCEIAGHKVDRYQEDVGIICFCNEYVSDVAAHMGKKYAVDIPDPESALSIISNILGVEGHMGKCSYTKDHNRNHYLKSVKDQWQDEFRFVFPGITERIDIEIPPGIGRDLRPIYNDKGWANPMHCWTDIFIRGS